ncbi:kappaPI-actitoxin-Avd3c-like [Drosophila novamexicana]|uniref:kappaPI-actitoxin-Avd3c-like n=1 Tax=Drosophila novamexicana TaxID=47314 RepID=UPI0011E59E8A|nr:kappaPI-actitoxin-Avd3c-like [Drosophila novamexicana]
MKLILYFLVLAAYVGSSLALKHEVCDLPYADNGIDIGRIYLILNNRWSYNSVNNKCTLFSYRGCCGNANNFLTQADCEEKCLEQITNEDSMIA